MKEFAGVALQFLSAASVVTAFILLLLRTFPAGEAGEPALPSRDRWFARGNLRVLAWAAAAAVGSRLLLTALAWLALAGARAWGGEDTRMLLERYGAGSFFVPLDALFNRWDAPHYLDIAKYGYTSDLTVNGGEQHWFIVFYPLYPALIALLRPLAGNEFNAGTAISWAALAGACYFIYKLSLLDNEKPEARRAVKFLLVFPAAVFLGAPYTESLFLLLTALCLYALRKGQFWAAGVAGFFAALTRNLGLLLVVPFVLELADRLGAFRDLKRLGTGRFWLEFLRRGAWVLLIPLGAGVYLLVNQVAYGDPFAFLAIQSDHWGQRLQPFWKTVETTWNCLLGDRPDAEKPFLWAPQLAAMLGMLAALPFMMKKLRPSYACYLLVYTVVALSPAWLLSFSRYMMGCVPLLFGVAALTRNRWADRALTVLFAVWMLFLAAGYFLWMMVV
jgi:hypothetical protein